MKKNKDVHITLRMTEEEYEPYRKAIENLQISKSEFFRILISNSFNPDVHDKKKKRDVEKLMFYFNKSSNNINQIARRINTEALKGKVSDTFLMKMLNKLDLINESLFNGIEEFKNDK